MDNKKYNVLYNDTTDTLYIQTFSRYIDKLDIHILKNVNRNTNQLELSNFDLELKELNLKELSRKDYIIITKKSNFLVLTSEHERNIYFVDFHHKELLLRLEFSQIQIHNRISEVNAVYDTDDLLFIEYENNLHTDRETYNCYLKIDLEAGIEIIKTYIGVIITKFSNINCFYFIHKNLACLKSLSPVPILMMFNLKNVRREKTFISKEGISYIPHYIEQIAVNESDKYMINLSLLDVKISQFEPSFQNGIVMASVPSNGIARNILITDKYAVILYVNSKLVVFKIRSNNISNDHQAILSE